MPYIVKSSLDIGGKIIPWNEQESNRLLKEKQRKLDKMKKVKVEEKITEPIEKEEKEITNIQHNEEMKEENEPKEDSTKFFRSSKRNQRAGER